MYTADIEQNLVSIVVSPLQDDMRGRGGRRVGVGVLRACTIIQV